MTFQLYQSDFSFANAHFMKCLLPYELGRVGKTSLMNQYPQHMFCLYKHISQLCVITHTQAYVIALL
jgi:hypothetical protein